MGSIADKLAYLAETKALLIRNLAAKGYAVTEGMTFRQLAALVGEYSDGLADLIPGRLLLWNDEFDGDALDTSIWDYELGYVRNNEKQYYTNESKNISVSDGMLHIVALKDNPVSGYSWSSASIDSQLFPNGTEGAVSGVQRETGFSYGYGLIECKMRCLTPSSGVWPAFWSRGASQQSEGWPMCGEIDIGELFFNNSANSHRYNPGIFWYDWHYLAQKSQHATDTGLSAGSVVYKTVDTDWHTYGMERNADEMIFYFDRQEFCRIDLTKLEDSDILQAMGQPMSVKLNLAMGSTGGTIPDELESAQIDVEYVRYYAPSGVTAATDSGEWDFPNNMPAELAPGKIARIIPDRDMTSGRNQYLWWTSSDTSIADATAGLIRTKAGASGDVTVTMHDTFGNSKSADITVRADASCVSEEVREIPTNPSIVPYGETATINVRLVPYWITNHTVTAALETPIDGVTVSVAQSSHAIAKYSTPCSVISITNNGTATEDTETSLIVTAQDSGAVLRIPLTIKRMERKLDTTGMLAAYVADNIVNTSGTIGEIYDETGNDHDPLANLYYTASYNNGVCRVPGKGIQSQVQGGKFNPTSAEGFFFEQFYPGQSRTFVFSIKTGMTEMRSQYLTTHGLLSVVHSGIGSYNVSNTTDGRHGFAWSYSYTANTSEGSVSRCAVVPNSNVNSLVVGDTEWNDPNNPINPTGTPEDCVHGDEFETTVFCNYDAENMTIAMYMVADGEFLCCLYNGMANASTQDYFDQGRFNVVRNTVVSEAVLAEADDNPFYWRYGNGNQVCSDFVRAVCVYDHVLTKDEMLAVDAMLTEFF